jgi:hypothetical protein
MLARISPILLVTAWVSACVTSGAPRHFAVPEDAQNPIAIRYRGATVPDIVNLVAQVTADVAIGTTQVVPGEGYVETRWIDIAQFNFGAQTASYPLQERIVVYAFQVSETGRGTGVLQIGGWYQPTRPTRTSPTRDSHYDRLLPTSHPAYQLSLEFEWRLKRAMTEKGITVIEEEPDEGR